MGESVFTEVWRWLSWLIEHSMVPHNFYVKCVTAWDKYMLILLSDEGLILKNVDKQALKMRIFPFSDHFKSFLFSEFAHIM